MTDDAARDAALREEGRMQGLREAVKWCEAEQSVWAAQVGAYAKGSRNALVAKVRENAMKGAAAELRLLAPTPDASQGSAPVAERQFPVLAGSDHKEYARVKAPGSVPWSLLAPHEEWAQRNHSQSLEKLARRGGLSMCEMVAIIEHRRWRGMTADEQMTSLRRHLAEHAASSAPPAAPQGSACKTCGKPDKGDTFCSSSWHFETHTSPTPTTVAAPQGSPLPGQLPETEAYCLAVAEAIRPAGWDLAGQTVLAVIQGIKAISRTSPEGGALEGELAEALREALAVIQGRRSRAGVNYANWGNLIARAAIGQGGRTWQRERADLLAWLPAIEPEKLPADDAAAGLSILERIKRGEHEGASQPPAPAIPQSGDEKEGT